MQSKLVRLLYLLPVLLIAHAIGFWNRGVLDKEAISFIVNYLADRPLVAAVFDPRLNDWGAYQARELSYLFDLIDARLFATLLSRDVLLFIPVSGALGLAALSVIYLYGAHRILRADSVTTILLLSLFLSCIVTQASTAYFYRSSKILLSVALVAFLFALTSALASTGKGSRASARALAGLFGLGLTMSLSDRQGFYLLCVGALVAGLVWLSAFLRGRAIATGYRPVLLTCLAAVGASVVYNYYFAPWIIHRANGYWPSFEYQTLPWADLQVGTLADQAFQMFRAQVSYFFGNVPFSLVCVTAGALGAATAWSRSRSDASRPPPIDVSDALIIALVPSLSVIAILAGMILRHPPVFGSFWYDTLAFEATFLFSASLALSVSDGFRRGWSRAAIYALLTLLIVGNVRQYDVQRQFMASSAPWFRTQHARSVTWARDFQAARLEGRGGGQSSWIHRGPVGATLELPIQDHNYLDGMRLAFDTLMHRSPLEDAGGPFWPALHGFLQRAGSPVGDREQIGQAIQAFRSIGIRHVTLDRSRYSDADLARTTVSALAASAPESRFSDDGRVLAVDLGGFASPTPALEPLTILPRSSFAATTGQNQERLRLAFDGDPDSRWVSAHPQSGDEWIRIEFDRTRDVGRVRMTLVDRSLNEYPRELLIEAVDGPHVQTLYRGCPLAALMRGILREPWEPPIDIVLPTNRSRALLLRQVGHSPDPFWSVHEITFWERRSS